LLYGTEIRFKAGVEIDGAEAPHENSGRAYFGDNLEGRALESTVSNKFAKQIARLNAIRRSVPALQKGVMTHYGETDRRFWFVRDYNEGQSYAVVGLAQDGGTIRVSKVRGGEYVDAVTGDRRKVAEGGALEFVVKAGSASIYVRDGSGKIGIDGEYLR
jgi:hypothetical protein